MFNKDEKIHEALVGKIENHLMQNEDVLNITRISQISYFLTQHRLIMMQSTSKKGRNVNVTSFYFKDVLSVQYLDIATKHNPHDKLIVTLKGNVLKSRYDLILPTQFAQQLNNIINTVKVGD